MVYDQTRAYRQLRDRKCVTCWSDKLTTANSPCDLWSTVDRLIGRGRRACGGLSADDLSTLFAEKVERIRSTTSDSARRRFVPRRLASRLPSLRHCHRTTLLLPLHDYQTTRTPRIQLHFRCWRSFQMYSRHFWHTCSTVRWPPTAYLLLSRTRLLRRV